MSYDEVIRTGRTTPPSSFGCVNGLESSKFSVNCEDKLQFKLGITYGNSLDASVHSSSTVVLSPPGTWTNLEEVAIGVSR